MMNLKKLFFSLGVIFSISIGNCFFSTTSVIPVAFAASIEVNRSSVWYERLGNSSRMVGAEVIFNGEPMTVSYWCIPNGNVENIYQQKNGSDWVFIGTRGPTNVEWNFPSQDSIDLFILIANAAAQSHGYDHFD